MWQLGWSWFLTNKTTSLLILQLFCSMFLLLFPFPSQILQHTQKSLFFSQLAASQWAESVALSHFRPVWPCLVTRCFTGERTLGRAWAALSCCWTLCLGQAAVNKTSPRKTKPFLNWVGQGWSWIQRCRWPLVCWWGCREKLICHPCSSTMGFTQLRSSCFGDYKYCSPDSQEFGDTWYIGPFQCCPRHIVLSAAVHSFEFLAKSI